jgi:RHS repeat-associated protein
MAHGGRVEEAVKGQPSMSTSSLGARRVSYTYLGRNTAVKAEYPEPGVTWNLATGSGVNPYTGVDGFGRVIDCRWMDSGSGSSSGSSSTDVERIEYGYDANSNRLWRHNTVAPSGGNDELYGYDNVQRLTQMQRGNLTDGNTAISDQSLEQDWTLDATGNWSEFKDYANGSLDLDQTRTSNTVNEITEISQDSGQPAWVTPAYDAAGNMTTIPSGLDPTVALSGTYDAWNRLVSVSNGSATIATYAYDGLNRRVTKTVGTNVRDCYFSTQWQALEEWLNGTLDRQFVWGLRYIDDLVLRDRFASGSLSDRYYALQDANWNVTAICDTTGAVQERYRYTAYGVPTFLNADFTAKDDSGFDWETLYTGYRLDAEGGIYQVRLRYLLPALGSWITVDPVGYIGGFNFYAYATQRPLTRIDPSGTDCTSPMFIDELTPKVIAISGRLAIDASTNPAQVTAEPTRDLSCQRTRTFRVNYYCCCKIGSWLTGGSSIQKGWQI